MLMVSERRARRWARRHDADRLADRPAGGHPVHGLLPAEIVAILALHHDWGEVDGSHRKLAHRGSYHISAACGFRRPPCAAFWLHMDAFCRTVRAASRASARPGRSG